MDCRTEDGPKDKSVGDSGRYEEVAREDDAVRLARGDKLGDFGEAAHGFVVVFDSEAESEPNGKVDDKECAIRPNTKRRNERECWITELCCGTEVFVVHSGDHGTLALVNDCSCLECCECAPISRNLHNGALFIDERDRVPEGRAKALTHVDIIETPNVQECRALGRRKGHIKASLRPFNGTSHGRRNL